MSVMAGAASPAGRHFPTTRLKVVFSLVLAAAIFYFLLKRVDLAGVWAQIQEMTWFELLTIGVIAAWNQVTYWALWVAVTPGLGYRQAMVVALSGTAVTNTVPGGSGVGVGLTYAMLESWGFSRARSTIAVLISGVWNSFIKFTLPVLALVLVALQGDASGARVATGLVGIALLAAAVTLFVLVLRSDRGASRVGELAGRVASRVRALIRRPPVQGWEPATVKFRSRTIDLLRDRWPTVTATALVSHLSLYLVLLVSLRHAGVPDAAVGWAEVLAVFAFARLVTVVRFTPGGVGFVEAVLMAGLIAAGGAPADVVAAVLIFRALTWLLPVPLGALAYAGWRWQQRRRMLEAQAASAAVAVESRPPSA
jgi:uncharacterized membrane protein YbhN (UPF0104 family)